MPLKRLRNKTGRENLWIYILSLMHDTPVYAYEIREKIEERFGFRIGKVTAYMVLYRLEKDGYVKTEWKNTETRPRKYYNITDEGKSLLEDGISHFEDLVKKLKENR